MSKQKKTKKDKKQEKEAEVFVLGNKVRTVKINQRQHLMFYIAMMVLFNAILVASVAFVLVYLNMWYNWVLCFMVVAVCAYLTFHTYLHEKKFHKCMIHSNAIVVKSIWFNFVADFSKIVLIKPKKSVLDKMFKLNTYSLEVRLTNSKRKKFTIHFIEEDIKKLQLELEEYVANSKQEQPEIATAQTNQTKED